MILIALGANLPSPAGPPADTIRASILAMEKRGIEIVGLSRLYRSEAWPNPADPPFVNAAAMVRTRRSPKALLAELHSLEQAFGRVSGIRNAPRTLDLDILDYEALVETGPPVLPHPRMEDRAFVLVPLGEIVPEWRHPISRRSIMELIASLPDRGRNIHLL